MSRSVLIVDDDLEYRACLEGVLQQMGCAVFTAENGTHALEVLQHVRPDLLIVDLLMPVMDGWALCAALEKNRQLADIPVVILSGASGSGPMGHMRVLSKPVVPETIMALLEAANGTPALPATPALEEALSQRLEPRADPMHASSIFGDGRVMSSVCHDLRSPMSSIVMGAELLQRSLAAANGSETAKRVVANLIRSAAQLTRLVSDLEDVARLDRGDLVIEPQTVDAWSLLETACKDAPPSAAAKGVTIAMSSAPASAAIECDRARILQALRELIENAVRYSPEDGTVRIDVEVRGGEARFSVCDDGRGMSDERRAHAFDPRWHAAQSPRDGTGLGLALVRGIAVAHGGDAAIGPVRERGTLASFWFPTRLTAHTGCFGPANA
jgi:signal transduction histidine kinase